MPPLLTIAIFLWIAGTVQNYILEPIATLVQKVTVRLIQDIRSENDFLASELSRPNPRRDGVPYQRLEDGTFIPQRVYDEVLKYRGEEPMPRTAPYIYRAYVRLVYLPPSAMIPLLLCIFILVLYLLGKLIAAGVGRFTVGLVEQGIARVPLVRNVYSAVKQVSGFLLNERKMDVSRVVAVEYPRKGVWAIGLVTGQGMHDIEGITGETCISVMICTSPMPMAGFTINIRRSEAIDLNITLDQAIQFIVSCGVIVPGPHGLPLHGPAPKAPRAIAADPPAPPKGND
jgi:uncharacterized membrane protein